MAAAAGSARVISGTVLSASGQPVALARVYVLAAPGPVPDVALLTGADGRFEIGALQPGAYEIGASTDGLGSGRVAVRVTRSGAQVQIKLGG